MISFAIEGVPVPKGRPRMSVVKMGNAHRVHVHTPQETINAERAVRLQCNKYRLRKPMVGAVGVTTVFVMPMPISLDADRSRDWPHVAPDDDNLRKLFVDAVEGLFWSNDGQVCGGQSWKVYGDRPRTFVRIWQLGRDDLARVREMIGDPMPQVELFGG